MPAQMKIALAQMNPVMGDIAWNMALARRARLEAHEQGADVVVLTELFACGYPPEDLVMKPSFLASIREQIEALARDTSDGGCAIIIGAPWEESGKHYNAALLLDQGMVCACVFKSDLPNYGPFDEKRLFTAAPPPEPVTFRGVRLGLMICEDMWTPTAAAHLHNRGANILIVINGSPFEIGKETQRRTLAAARVAETGLPLVYVNQLGGQDELVFDGASFAFNRSGQAIFNGQPWVENITTLFYDDADLSGSLDAIFEPDISGVIYQALMLGLRDYVEKNKFSGVVLGLSGGIDSALAALLAVDALGAGRVWGVMLPSPFTSLDSTEDAQVLARQLGIRLDSVSITSAMEVFDLTLTPVLGEKLDGTVPENIQSRCRGLILMALSNACGHMVLSTGNKSEMSTGYATLYGDMCGGFAILKDVYKTQVYNVAHWRNTHVPVTGLGPAGVVIPQRIMTKAPTAELRLDQKDQDSLPPYEILDAILEGLIEGDLSVQQVIARGYDASTVNRVWIMLDRAEYKRRQAPPGVKVTSRTLSRDRRYPITNAYCEQG